MKPMLTRLTLGVAGVLAFGIGAAITLTPDAFYGSYGVVLPASPDFKSEIRAPGANLAVLGALMFIGALRAAWIRFSAALGTCVFLAYAAGRIIGIALDGLPSEAILLALVIELTLGGLCAQALRRTGREAGSQRSAQPAH